jgi:hypothetical protein
VFKINSYDINVTFENHERLAIPDIIELEYDRHLVIRPTSDDQALTHDAVRTL